ncbi:hypothetical protein GCM10009733_103350 [Nonomuraea maheshkhaliensis]|uniref:Uncharacterized protein n=1 Tax=Nonomuraea maheshkhaliensis TaxID=419590 RepID=A0ABP4TNW2_9ACTN
MLVINPTTAEAVNNAPVRTMNDQEPVSEDERKRQAWLERHAALAPRLSPEEWAAANTCLGIRVSGSRVSARPGRQAA